MDLGNNISIRSLIIGDPAYPLCEWLMKPYPLADIPARQETFNRNLSRARVVVEQAFGQLEGRWRSVYKRWVQKFVNQRFKESLNFPAVFSHCLHQL